MCGLGTSAIFGRKLDAVDNRSAFVGDRHSPELTRPGNDAFAQYLACSSQGFLPHLVHRRQLGASFVNDRFAVHHMKIVSGHVRAPCMKAGACRVSQLSAPEKIADSLTSVSHFQRLPFSIYGKWVPLGGG